MSLTSADYALLAQLLQHPALPGMGAVGREAAGLLAKVQAAAAVESSTEELPEGWNEQSDDDA